MLLQFVDRQIITPGTLPKFEACIKSALRLRNSVLFELGLVVLIVTTESFWWEGIVAIPVTTWYATMTSSGSSLAPAGYWYVFVSLPSTQFITVRWYFRIVVWGRLLFQISRLKLNLIPTHPDSCCGLGFLGSNAFTLAARRPISAIFPCTFCASSVKACAYSVIVPLTTPYRRVGQPSTPLRICRTRVHPECDVRSRAGRMCHKYRFSARVNKDSCAKRYQDLRLRPPGIGRLYGQAVLIVLRCVGVETGEALASCVDDKKIAVRAIVPTQANIAGDRLVVSRV